MTSTCGDGELPPSAQKFSSYLDNNPDLKLDHIRYSVFGIGDKKFQYFSRASEIMNGKLVKKCCTSLLANAGETKVDVNDYDEIFDSWSKKVKAASS